MTDVEYDSAAMRQAMKALQDAYDSLGDFPKEAREALYVGPPGTSDKTKQFHHYLQNSVKATEKNHQIGRRQIAEALNTLIAIDREYNKGELANELSLKTIKIGE